MNEILLELIAAGLIALSAYLFGRTILIAAMKGSASRGVNDFAVRLVIFNYGFGTASIPCTGHTALFPRKNGGGSAAAQVDLIAVEHPKDDPISIPPWGAVEVGTLPFRARLAFTAGKGLENEEYVEISLRSAEGKRFNVRFLLPETITLAVANAQTGEWAYPPGMSVRMSIAQYPYTSWWRKLQQKRTERHISHEDQISQNWPRWAEDDQ